ncbi:MAG TPA: molybdopterin molybdotransferase MoeA [Nitrososphaerales archaeon]|nr:molybdopterin molybdotransferase MoeA [Nitrososphaerales archaeon]
MSSRPDSQRYLKLLEISQVMERIRSAFQDYEPAIERVRLDEALGRVLAEDIVAKEDLPPTTISAMDGYAVRHSAIVSASTSNPSEFQIKGELYPKDVANSSLIPSIDSDGDAYYVATGAPIPAGCDVVARIEDTRVDAEGRRVTISKDIPKWKNISLKGEDIHAGDLLFQRRRILNSSDAATMIGLGYREVSGFATPRVGILSIGSELVEFDPLKEHANRRTINNYSNLIAGYLSECGATAVPLGVVEDDQDSISAKILSGIANCEMIITIAGSSVGAKDYAPNALLALENSKMLFHGVRAVPIRPAGLGVVGKSRAVAILPGHAVSAALAFFVVVLPVLNMLSGLEMDSRRVLLNATAENEFYNDRAIEALSLVHISRSDREKGKEQEEHGNKSQAGTEGIEYSATSLEWGSNLLSNLSKAHGFVWLAPHERISKSQRVKVQLLGSSELLRI